MDAEDFPLLGEPLAVELANTHYVDGDEVIDFLQPRTRGEAWLRHALPPGLAPAPRWTVAAIDRLRELRDAVHAVLAACVDARVPPDAAVAVVNAFAAAAGAHAALHWTDAGPRGRVAFSGEPAAVVGARLATSCIEVVLGHPERAVRRCAGAGCAMLFVQQHGRRRFCHAGCSHRARQQRYVQARRVGSP